MIFQMQKLSSFSFNITSELNLVAPVDWSDIWKTFELKDVKGVILNKKYQYIIIKYQKIKYQYSKK